MLVQQLTPLEQKVMDILWEKGNSSARQIRIELKPHKLLAYTTIATILTRLYTKGVVTKQMVGNTWYYSPNINKREHSKFIAQTFWKKFFSTYGETAISSFIDSFDTLPEKKRRQLLELLKQHDKRK